MLQVRTDLALEATALWQKSRPSHPLKGVQTRQSRCFGCAVTRVEITDDEAADALGKPRGVYLTVELPEPEQEGGISRAAACLGELLRGLLPSEGPVLAVGLGNRAMTPDAVGPLAMEGVLVTRHLIASLPASFGSFRPVSAAAPGVTAATGVEAAEAVGALVQRLHPAAVIVVDALASRALERVCRTVQLSDSGIVPGSGVGNHRQAIDHRSLGVPVIAVGVPTVVDGATLAADLLEEAGTDIDPKVLAGRGQSLFVTPRDVDAQVKRLAKLIGGGINRALQPQLDDAQLGALLEQG